MDRRGVITFWIFYFSILTYATSENSGFLLENEETLKFVPIPIPWGNEESPRQLNFTFLIRTDNTKGTLVSGSSVNQKHFDFTLSLDNEQVKLIVNIHGHEVVQFIDRSMFHFLSKFLICTL